MISLGKLIIGLVGGLVVSVAARADMVPVAQLDAERRQSPRVCGRTDLQHMNLSSPFYYSGLADPGSWSVEFLPEADADVAQTAPIPNLQTLTNGPSSLNLCLSALIGLGLYSSAHWVKRLSLGCVPEWFHDVGPFQIAHSLAVSPESLCPAPACCFVQPIWAVTDSCPQYRLGALESLWRKSQFTPDLLAARGPPVTC